MDGDGKDYVMEKRTEDGEHEDGTEHVEGRRVEGGEHRGVSKLRARSLVRCARRVADTASKPALMSRERGLAQPGEAEDRPPKRAGLHVQVGGVRWPTMQMMANLVVQVRQMEEELWETFRRKTKALEQEEGIMVCEV